MLNKFILLLKSESYLKPKHTPNFLWNYSQLSENIQVIVFLELSRKDYELKCLTRLEFWRRILMVKDRRNRATSVTIMSHCQGSRSQSCRRRTGADTSPVPYRSTGTPPSKEQPNRSSMDFITPGLRGHLKLYDLDCSRIWCF